MKKKVEDGRRYLVALFALLIALLFLPRGWQRKLRPRNLSEL